MTRSIFKFATKPNTNNYWKKNRDEPSRMWRPKSDEVNKSKSESHDTLDLLDPNHITEDSFDLLLIPPEKENNGSKLNKKVYKNVENIYVF